MPEGKAHTQIIYEAQITLHEVRKELHQSNLENTISTQTKKRLAAAVINYYEALRPLKNKPKIKDKWKQSNLGLLREYSQEKTQIEIEGPGHGPSKQTKTIPKILEIDTETLLNLSYTLDEIADRLGLSAEVDEGTRTFNWELEEELEQ